MGRRMNKKDVYREKFFRVPKVFMTNEKYIKLSNNAKIAYAILQDRYDLSIKNGWYDEKGDIYFVYSNPQLMDILNLSRQTMINVKKELDKADLLDEERTGRANRMYLLRPEVTEDDIYKIDEAENPQAENPDDLLPEKDGSDQAYQAKSKNHTSGDVKDLDDRSLKTRHQKSKNHTSDVKNLDPNDTELSDTYFSENNYSDTYSSSSSYKENISYIEKQKIKKQEEEEEIKNIINNGDNFFSELPFLLEHFTLPVSEKDFLNIVKKMIELDCCWFTAKNIRDAVKTTKDGLVKGNIIKPIEYLATCISNEVIKSGLSVTAIKEEQERQARIEERRRRAPYFNWLEEREEIS